MLSSTFDQWKSPEMPLSDRERKEIIFVNILNNALLSKMIETMQEIDFTDHEIEAFKNAVSFLTEKETKAFFSIPYEIIKRRLLAMKKQAEESSWKTCVSDFAKHALQEGHTFGYHVSSQNVPQRELKNGEISWNIHGTEMDDRDQLMRAYYSLDYENIYREKPAHFLYVVRADASHRVDSTTHWGRASTLSVIQQIDLANMDARVREEFIKETMK